MSEAKVNPQLVREAVEKRGENGLAKLSVESGLSISLLGQLMAGNYRRGLTIKTASTLRDALGVDSIDALFVAEEAS